MGPNPMRVGGCADRSGPGNLNKPLCGESATVDTLTGGRNGADDGKTNETDALSSVCLGWIAVSSCEER